MKNSALLFTTFIILISCQNKQKKGEVGKNTYLVCQIPELKIFETYNEIEKDFDKTINQLVGKGGFRNNRSRIFTQSFSNRKVTTQDSALYKGLATPCYCNYVNDTLTVKVGIGFFGGMGFETKIFENHFQSNYFFYTDDVKPYKQKLTDKDFTDNLYLENKIQSLILNEEPTFKSGQQIKGYLTFTSSVWYEKSFKNEIDTNYITGKLYFTCLTK